MGGLLLINSAMTFKVGFPISILVVVGALPPPHLAGAPGVGDGGSYHRLVGGAVYISSCQHTNI